MNVTSPRGQLMKTYLPPLYERSRVMDAILESQGRELDALREAITTILDNAFVRTSTWGLDTWEEELGLPPAPDQPESERRDRIVSRLRGIGTATIAVVKQTAEAYDHGEVDVIEDHAVYTVTIRFVDTTGVPPNLDDLKAALRGVVPAHLDVLYAFNFLVWDELDAKGWDWDTLDSQNLAWDALEVLN